VRILSIDWDFFFPNGIWYDWGHSEHNSIFAEFVWNIRAQSRHAKTGLQAINECVPDTNMLRWFWRRVLDGVVDRLWIAESHQQMYDVVSGLGEPTEIWNFDAHHDCGYVDGLREDIDCGNWGWHLLRDGHASKIIQVYPEWRKDDPEDYRERPADHQYEVRYWPDSQPMAFDCMYVCRSPAWSPSWADAAWLRFIRRAQDMACSGSTIKSAMKKRRFDPVDFEALTTASGTSIGALNSLVMAEAKL